MLPIKFALRNHADRVDIWRDRLVCRDLDRSIDRFRQFIANCKARDERLSIITHSFGDWIVRQALQKSPDNQVDALVSIAPVIARSPVGIVLNCLGGSFVSEVSVIANASRAAENAVVTTTVRRLVIWGYFDIWVRPFAMPEIDNQTVEHFFATHLSIVMQPNVLRLVSGFLNSRTEIRRIVGIT